MEKIRQKAKGKVQKAKGCGGDSISHATRNTQYAAGLMAGVGAAMAGYALFWEPSDVRLEHVTLRVPRSAGVLPEAGLRILHLSDFHFQGRDWREQPKIRKVKRLTQGLEYDLLIHTGDFLHTDGGMANVFALLDALPKPRLGAYAVMGNHDYVCYDMRDVIVYSWRNFLRWEADHRQRSFILTPRNRWEKAKQMAYFSHFLMNYPVEAKRTGWNDVATLTDELAKRGIQVLHNRAVRLTTHHPAIGDVDLHIAGIDDLHEGAPDLDTVLAGIPPAGADPAPQPQPGHPGPSRRPPGRRGPGRPHPRRPDRAAHFWARPTPIPNTWAAGKPPAPCSGPTPKSTSTGAWAKASPSASALRPWWRW